MSVFRTLSGDVGVTMDDLNATEMIQVNEAFKRIHQIAGRESDPVVLCAIASLAAFLVVIVVTAILASVGFDALPGFSPFMMGIAIGISALMGVGVFMWVQEKREAHNTRDHVELMRLAATNEQLRVLYDTCLMVKYDFKEACKRVEAKTPAPAATA